MKLVVTIALHDADAPVISVTHGSSTRSFNRSSPDLPFPSHGVRAVPFIQPHRN
jgi:hypothetical protein